MALSSTEAEYMAISDCSKQVIWIKALLLEIGILLKSVPIYGDNQGSIFNPVQESHSKHIDIQYHFIRDLVSAKEVELMFVPGEMNPARGLLTEPQVSLSTELTELGELGTKQCRVDIPPQPNWLS